MNVTPPVPTLWRAAAISRGVRSPLAVDVVVGRRGHAGVRQP
jgi:hypothetical protein